MARTAIHTHDLNRLPAICAKTGVPATSTRRQEFVDIPGWTLFLILWGVIPFLIAAVFSRRKVEVALPASPETLHRVRLVDRLSIAGLLLGIGWLLVSLFTGGYRWAWAGVVVVILTVVVGAIARRRVWVVGRLDGEILRLYGVDPSFAQQMESADSTPSTNDETPAVLFALLAVAIVVLVVLMLWPRS